MQIKELGHVVFYVTDLHASVAFYRDTLGFQMVADMSGAAVFSSGRTHHEMLLIEIGGQPDRHIGPKPGLYHVGFKVGDGPDVIRAVYKELVDKGVSVVGTADHGVTHSIYILDPDGNELELYADVSDLWKTHPTAILSPVKPLYL